MERINFEENLIMARATWCLIRCKISCAIITFQADDRCNKVHYTRNFSNSLMPSTSHFHRGLLYFTNALLWALRPMFHAVSPKMFYAFLRTAANQCMNFCKCLVAGFSAFCQHFVQLIYRKQITTVRGLPMLMTFSTCRDPCIQAVRQSVQSIFQFCDSGLLLQWILP